MAAQGGSTAQAEAPAEVGNDGAVAVTLRIDGVSVNSKQKQRDKHLRFADFFDTAHHPTVAFTSSRVTVAGAGSLDVAGDLTAAGHGRPYAARPLAARQPASRRWLTRTSASTVPPSA
jgi:polyisoprenoid-binding protein YceI